MRGIVMKCAGSLHTVLAEDGRKTVCRIRGRLRIDDYKSTNPVVVGDKVIFEPGPDGTGTITEIEERKNCIIRKAKNLSRRSHILAVNIDQAILLATLVMPKTSFGFIDRFLATAEAYRIPARIIFNKADIVSKDVHLEAELKRIMSVYTAIGYPCHSICSLNMSETVKKEMRTVLQHKISLLAGHSGTGKSTFLNALEPSLNLKTGKISEAHLKGIHTTTISEMFPLSFGGFIIDTPGIQEFGLIKMDRNEIYHFFPEIFRTASGCKYNNCLHLDEPKCAVRSAVESGNISASRYHSYLSIMNGDETVKEYD